MTQTILERLVAGHVSPPEAAQEVLKMQPAGVGIRSALSELIQQAVLETVTQPSFVELAKALLDDPGSSEINATTTAATAATDSRNPEPNAVLSQMASVMFEEEACTLTIEALYLFRSA